MRPNDFETAGRCPSRRGTITTATVIALVFFFVLFLLLMDLYRVISEKSEEQNAADANAFSPAEWLARGLNALTGTNHLMGEMMSLVVIHEAIAGENVDGADLSAADRARATQADAELMTLQPLAHAVGGWTISYPYVVQPLMAAATVGEGKLNLKEAVVRLYQDQIAASLLPGGWIIIEELNLAELKMLDEWLFLDELEQLCRASLPLKEELFNTLLPAAKAYEDEVVKTVPILAAQTVQRLFEPERCARGGRPESAAVAGGAGGI